ncbi:MAG: hypothetical protein ACK4GJ_06435 [bacterium]
MRLIISLLLCFFILNIAEGLSISSDNKLACQLFSGNKYYLIDLKEKRILKSTQLDDHYDKVFFISSDKIILQKVPDLYILNAFWLTKERKFVFSEEIKKILPIKENISEIHFIVFTNYYMSYFVYNRNKKTIKLLKRKSLIKFNDAIAKDNLLFVANDTNISIFKLNIFLGLLSSKNINTKDVVYSLDTGKNKYLVLHYISKEQRKVSWYTKEGMRIKDINLEGRYYKIFFSFDEKSAVLFDQTNSLKILSFNGEIKESNIFRKKILEIEKLQDGWILFAEDGGIAILDKEFYY